MADLLLLELGGEHALHGGLDLVDAVVDDPVHPHVHVVTLGVLLGIGVGADVEAHNDGVGGGGQHHVGLVDGANGAVDDLHPDLLVGDLLQAGLYRLSGALHVGLDDNIQILHLALLDLGEQVLQGDLAAGAGGGKLLVLLALLGQLPGHALVGHGVEVVARLRDLGHADDLHGYRRSGLGDLLAGGVGHGPDTAHGGAGDDNVALLQSAVLHQEGGHGAAALLQPRLHHRTMGGAVRVGLQLLHVGGEGDHLQQVVDAHAGFGGDGADDGVAAPLLGHQLIGAAA